MKMESIYSIQKKKKWMSHLFIISMQLMKYLWIMMTIIFINIMHHFYRQITMKMYLQDQNMIHKNEEFVITKKLFWVYY